MSSLVIKFSVLLEHMILMGRNSRWPNRANHGARPCSSVMRRMRREGFYQRPRAEGNAGVDIATDDDEMDADEDLEAEGQENAGEEGAQAGTGQGGAAAGKEGDKGGKDQKAQGKDAGKADAGAGKADANKQETGKAKSK